MSGLVTHEPDAPEPIIRPARTFQVIVFHHAGVFALWLCGLKNRIKMTSSRSLALASVAARGRSGLGSS
jgi:hypothetical protein